MLVTCTNSGAKVLKKNDTHKLFRTFLYFYSELFCTFTPNFFITLLLPPPFAVNKFTTTNVYLFQDTILVK